MTTFTGHGDWNLSDWDLTALLNATVQSPHANHFTLVAADGTETYFRGDDFSGYDGTGFPSQGIVTSLTVTGDTGAFSLAGLDLSMHQLRAIAAHDDMARLEKLIFAGNDSFNLADGDASNVDGGKGDDTFLFGGALDDQDRVEGGHGYDTVRLDGDYSTTLALDADTFHNIEALTLAGGHSYVLTLADGNIAHGQTFAVNAGTLGAGDVLALNATNEQGGSLDVMGGDGDDSIRTGTGADIIAGGAGRDEINGGKGADTIRGGDDADKLNGDNGDDAIDGGTGNDKISSGDGADDLAGGIGDDHFYMRSHLGLGDVIEGGDGYDVVHVNGADAATMTISGAMVHNIEEISLGRGHNYRVNFDDTDYGNHMKVDGSALAAGEDLVLDGSQIDGNSLTVLGGAGEDSITGTQVGDVISGGDAADLLDGGDGPDTFLYDLVSDSTGTVVDTITGFDAAEDTIDTVQAVTGVDASIVGGLLGDLGDLATLPGLAALGAGHAVLVQPLLGDLAGTNLLVVDQNGIAGYQPGSDLVIQLANPSNLGALTEDIFT